MLNFYYSILISTVTSTVFFILYKKKCLYQVLPEQTGENKVYSHFLHVNKCSTMTAVIW
jgi:hypothetical protein